MSDSIKLNNDMLVAGDAAKDLCAGADLTYHHFIDSRIFKVDARRSLLYGTVFQNSTFNNVKFDNSDIEGARFSDCIFIECSFVDADIRSCNFLNCLLQNCSFEQSLLLDVTAQNCDFIKTTFARSSIHESFFENSKLNECSFKNASALHNSFVETTFKKIRIADCAFLYALMLNCSFESIELNAEAVGTIYGMSRADLESMKMVFLGEPQQLQGQNLIQSLKDSYHQRKWYFLEAMLEVFYGPVHKLMALSQALCILCEMASAGIVVKRDEFKFVAKISEELSKQGCLPMSFLVYATDKTGALLDRSDLARGSISVIQEFHSSVYLLLNKSIEIYAAEVGKLSAEINGKSPVLITLTYRDRPAIDGATAVNIAASLVSENEPTATLLSARPGSWVEIIQTTAFGAIAIYAIVVATNGIVAQLIRTKALATALLQPVPKQAVRRLIQQHLLSSNDGYPNKLIRESLGVLSAITNNQDVHKSLAEGFEKLESMSIEECK